jgi:hypothetical protein
VRGIVVALVLAATATACGGSPAARPEVSSDLTSASAPVSSPSPSAATTPAPGTQPPPWLGTRPLPLTPDGYGEVQPTPPELRQRRFTLPDRLPPLPGRGFAARVTTPAPRSVIARSTWAPGCPVPARRLSWVRLTFRGFDGSRHTGELLVHRSVAADIVRVFRDLYAARFPIEEMRITTKAEQTAPPTGDGNDTGAFNCRPMRGSTTYSEHAYGLAIDVNPFQNPYLKGALVLPELAGAYRDRTWRRPGMIFRAGPVVRAFARIGWTWGGSWHSLRDLQHFSSNGR